ncbi:autoinducer binding domain-containing protein [Serratia ureilytica]
MTVTFANAVAARLHLDCRLHAFSQFKYAYLTFNKHHPDRHLLVSSYPQEWLDIYSANRYQRIDPVVRAAHSRCAPLCGTTPHHHRGSALPEDLQPGAGYDIVHGCSFVLHDHDNNLAILSISATAADDAELRQLMEDERPACRWYWSIPTSTLWPWPAPRRAGQTGSRRAKGKSSTGPARQNLP